jgi:hypothetical protein
VICKEWVHEHKLREPRQYIEGRESFHAIAETDEMYRAWWVSELLLEEEEEDEEEAKDRRSVNYRPRSE